MQPADDSALLRQYANNHSDEAFAALVARHINLVYSVALRQVGNPHQAEEITQAVFIILAKKAAGLRHDKALSSWLFQATHLTAKNFVRSEARRHRREQEAYMQTMVNEPENEIWPKITPLLDAAVAGLNEKERRAIVLRFYEGRNLRDVGFALGASEEAAKKRVNRALEKLQKFFARHGVSSTTAALAGAISANSVLAAPATLAKTTAAVALAKGTTASASTLTTIKGALKIMAWTKAKTVIVTAVVASLATFSVVQYQRKLHERNESLQQQPDQLSKLQVQNQSLSNQLAQANDSEALARGQLNKLLQQRAQESNTAARPPAQLVSPNPKSEAVNVPKDSWANAGLATPEATLQTRGWAVLNGNRDAFRQSVSVTDGARKIMQDMLVKMAEASTDPDKKRYIQEALDNKYDVEEAMLMPMMAENQNNTYTGYKILSQTTTSPDEMILQVETDMASAPPKVDTLTFQRFGGNWKVVVDENFINRMQNNR